MSISIKRRGRIIKYAGNGKVHIVLDDGTGPANQDNEYVVDLPLAFASPQGSIIAGYPEVDTAVFVEQGQGTWVISGFIRPDDVFSDTNTSNISGVFGNVMSDFKPNRILIQSKLAANRIYLQSPTEENPDNEIIAGNPLSSLQLDLTRDIFSHDFAQQYSFSGAHREIIGTVKRDINDNSLRNIDYSSLKDRQYDDLLWTVGMDPSIQPSVSTSLGLIRNLPLIENRKVIYEFQSSANEVDFEIDNIELLKLDPNYKRTSHEKVQRSEVRSVSFGLNLHYPNHLFEEILGTGVDTFGNIIDLNRSILPLGKGDFSFIDNANTSDAFIKIRNEHRKSIAYHFELNTRKENGATQKLSRGAGGLPEPSISEESLLGAYEPLSVYDVDNYARDRSRLFLDIDKEGQFKLNIPMSSEIGNIPLHTRYVNSSVLAFEEKDTPGPNDFILEDEGVDIFVEKYTNATNGILLKGIEGQVGPIDRFTKTPMKLNLVYHDILTAGYQFSKQRITDDPGGKLIRYQPDSSLNQRQGSIQYDKFVSTEINIAGPNANAGGRSGMVNLDGFISCSIGANTIDRQSMWLDMAGGMISTIGRDREGVSYLGQFDGDFLIQIGGHTIDSQGHIIDTRFENEDTSTKSGTLDIRVIRSDGQLTVVRIDEKGTTVASAGRVEVMAQQDIIFNSNTNILFEAPNIGFYYKTCPRFMERSPGKNL
jgi:hypothetical protein